MRCWVQTPDLHQKTRTGSGPKHNADVALQEMQWQDAVPGLRIGSNDNALT